MGSAEKKRLKAEAKRAKKEAKARVKAAAAGDRPAPAGASGGTGPSPGVRFAESVRGIIYVVLAASLVVALVLGQQDVIISLEDIIGSLFVAWAGKVVLMLIALALLIYGLKHLGVVR